MRKYLKFIMFAIILVGGIWFIFSSLSKSARSPEVAEAPALPKVPARVYGVIEPAGREVYVSSFVSRPIKEIYVKEGDVVTKGQKIILLEDDVELAQLKVALSRVESARKAYEISKYEFSRKKKLFEGRAVTEYEYNLARLKAELDSLNLDTALKEAQLARERVQQLELDSPIDGIVYKLDVRIGELLPAGGSLPIILGSPDLWVRLYVESFWMDRFENGDKCKVYNAETNEYLGMGTVINKSSYLTSRNFRTDEIIERFDAEFQQVILRLETEKKNIPLGLNIVALINKAD